MPTKEKGTSEAFAEALASEGLPQDPLELLGASLWLENQGYEVVTTITSVHFNPDAGPLKKVELHIGATMIKGRPVDKLVPCFDSGHLAVHYAPSKEAPNGSNQRFAFKIG